jgi:hypothetical protein
VGATSMDTTSVSGKRVPPPLRCIRVRGQAHVDFVISRIVRQSSNNAVHIAILVCTYAFIEVHNTVGCTVIVWRRRVPSKVTGCSSVASRNVWS